MINMKKKKSLFIVLLLLIIVIPFATIIGKKIDFSKVFAAVTVTPGYSYYQKLINADDLYSTSIRGVNKQMPSFRVSSSAGHGEQNNWFFHEARYGGRYYHGYCLHIGKSAHDKYDGNRTPKLTAYIYDDHFDTGVITNINGRPIDEANADQLKLLEALLASGYQYTTDNSKSIEGMSNEDALSMLTKQILVWEIVEGGRTTFDQYVPNVYNASDSAYYRIIVPAKLTSYYNYHIDKAKEYLREKDTDSSPIFGKTYTMKWNSSAQKFTTGPISGLGNFSSCVSSNADVTVSVDVNNKTVTVSSSKSNQTATITCTKVTGNGQNKWAYYRFMREDGSTQLTGWQDIINGTAGTTIKKSFNINTEAASIKVTKKNGDGSNLSGAKFTLTKKDNSSIVLNLNGNGGAATITQSGTYILRETSVPHGYSAIPDTELLIDISGTITCPGAHQGTDRNGNTTCQGGSITIKYSNNTFELVIVDAEKTFSIKKTDASGNPVYGATFKVYNGSNFTNEVSFSKTGNGFGCNFSYGTGGLTTTAIQGVECSTYYLELLPKGIYKIVETDVPSPYILATSEADRTMYIKVEDNYDIYLCTDSTCNSKTKTQNSTITVKNYGTTVSVKKIGNGGNPLANVKFVLYKEDKTTLVNSNLVAGRYKYSGTTTNQAAATVYVTGTNGIFVVDNLPVGTYYFKEIETVPPYVLPTGDDAYTKVTITMTKTGQLTKINDGKATTSTLVEISNATNTFNFYKVDEDGNYLAGGKYKIQKYDNDLGKYVDIKVKLVTNDGSYPAEADVFKEDANGKVQFTLAHGIATFIDMAPSTTYRVVELEAPNGYDITNIDNSAVIKIDANGYAKGSATIINQKRSLSGSTAQAELVIEIQTGQTVIKYGVIITGTLIVIVGLMGIIIFISKKRK